MADLAEGSAVETVAGSAPAAPADTSGAAHGTPSDDGSGSESNASPDASVASVEDGQDAEKLSRSQRRERARNRDGTFTSEPTADEPAGTEAVAESTPAPAPTFTADDIAREARRLRDEEKAQEAAAAAAAKAAEEAAEAERQSMATIAEMVGFAPGKVDQQTTQYDELIQAVTDRNWDTLEKYGVLYGDLDAALDLKASLDKQRKAWSEATTVADKRAWRVLDAQHEAIGKLPGVDADKFKAAMANSQPLLNSVKVAVETAVESARAALQAEHTKVVNDYKGQVATLEAKLEAAITQAASRMPAPDGGGRAWTGGVLTPADYSAMTTAQRIALRSTPEGRAQIDEMTRARLSA